MVKHIVENFVVYQPATHWIYGMILALIPVLSRRLLLLHQTMSMFWRSMGWFMGRLIVIGDICFAKGVGFIKLIGNCDRLTLVK
jgi:uncharacterized membrane protein YedE/YeeE